ncbi:hypothetical protein [Micromonospora siamensis]|uniref:hypothetical protein n=1 Tax=Micromonospora siamensis TaxID=299152 RepID=UPI000B5B01E3|nr:hypothetical protein [Micromonospora siamensis]
MTTVTRTPRQDQTRARLQTEAAPIWGLVLVTALAIVAVFCIVLVSGSHVGEVAQAAITAIGGVALASIGALGVVVRRRSSKSSRS